MSAWQRFLEGRTPHPIEPPTVVLLGCRPHTPAESFPDNPACPICGAFVRECGTYCIGCDRIAADDQAAIDMARKVTPSPRPDPLPPPIAPEPVADHPGPPRAIRAEQRRLLAWWRAEQRRRAVLASRHLKGGLG